MAYGTPADPVAGTVITVAYAIANFLDPIRWLRGMTGNADPPGSSYVVVSSSTTATGWSKIPADALAPGAALSNLGVTFGNGVNQIPINNGVSNPNLVAGTAGNSTLLAGAPPGNAAGQIAINNGVECVGLIAQLASNATLAVTATTATSATTATTATSATTATNAGNVTTSIGGTALASYNAPSATNASQVGGRTPTSTPTADAIPIADGSGKLDGWVTPAAFSIPSGLGFWVRQASHIPAGFTRDTSLDGLIPVGDGTTFSQTFTEGTSYGTSWAHGHSIPSLSVSVSSVTVTGAAVGGPEDNTGGPSATDGLGNNGGTTTPTAAHTHSLNGVSFAVSASGTGSGATGTGTAGSTTWLPPMRAVVWCRKD